MPIKFEWLNKDNQKIFEEIKARVFEDDDFKDFEADIFDRVNRDDVQEYGMISYALICHNDKRVGLIGYYTKKDDTENVWLGWFGILKEYRQMGFGKIALLEFEQWIIKNIPTVKAIRLYTGLNDNAVAVKLYKSCGYTIQPKVYEKCGEKDIVILGKMVYQEYKDEPVW